MVSAVFPNFAAPVEMVDSGVRIGGDQGRMLDPPLPADGINSRHHSSTHRVEMFPLW